MLLLLQGRQRKQRFPAAGDKKLHDEAFLGFRGIQHSVFLHQQGGTFFASLGGPCCCGCFLVSPNRHPQIGINVHFVRVVVIVVVVVAVFIVDVVVVDVFVPGRRGTNRRADERHRQAIGGLASYPYQVIVAPNVVFQDKETGSAHRQIGQL